MFNRRFRWIQYLESMGAKLCYIEGEKNVMADFIFSNIKETRHHLYLFIKIIVYRLSIDYVRIKSCELYCW